MDAQISSSTGKSVNVTIPLRTLPAAEKRKRAIKAWALSWLAAIVSAPFPPMHWVLVPGFLILGPYLFFRKLNQPTHTVPFSFKCPECGGEIPVAERVFEPQWEQVCPSCRFPLDVKTAAFKEEAQA